MTEDEVGKILQHSSECNVVGIQYDTQLTSSFIKNDK